MHRFSLALPGQGLTLMLCLVLSAYFVVALGERSAQILQLKNDEARLMREVATLHRTHAQLREERERLQSTTDIERVAREDLNLIKPGETAVIVIPSAAAVAAVKAEPAAAPADQSPPWRRWLDWIFGG